MDFIYIVLLTARSGIADYLEATRAGADDFIRKPFEKDALATRAVRLRASSAARR